MPETIDMARASLLIFLLRAAGCCCLPLLTQDPDLTECAIGPAIHKMSIFSPRVWPSWASARLCLASASFFHTSLALSFSWSSLPPAACPHGFLSLMVLLVPHGLQRHGELMSAFAISSCHALALRIPISTAELRGPFSKSDGQEQCHSLAQRVLGPYWPAAS